jgi:hypothetical protein
MSLSELAARVSELEREVSALKERFPGGKKRIGNAPWDDLTATRFLRKWFVKDESIANSYAKRIRNDHT